MRTPATVLTFVAAALLLFSCAPQADQQEAAPAVQVDTAAIRAASTARMDAMSAGDIEGYLTPYADDAIWMPPQSEDIAGKASARQRLAGLFDKEKVAATVTSEEMIVMSPEWVTDRGTYMVSRTPVSGGEATPQVGSYLTIWQHQEDGSWKIAFDTWNSDRPIE